EVGLAVLGAEVDGALERLGRPRQDRGAPVGGVAVLGANQGAQPAGSGRPAEQGAGADQGGGSQQGAVAHRGPLVGTGDDPGPRLRALLTARASATTPRGSLLRHVEADLVDRPGERELTLALVRRVDGGDRVAADLERLQPVPEERTLDL